MNKGHRAGTGWRAFWFGMALVVGAIGLRWVEFWPRGRADRGEVAAPIEDPGRQQLQLAFASQQIPEVSARANATAVAGARAARVRLWPSVQPSERAFADFHAWVDRCLVGQEPFTAEALAEGRRLAERRLGELEDLIATDPARALELALPYWVRRALPAAMSAVVETPVSGRGTLAVVAAVAAEGAGDGLAAMTWRQVLLGDAIYEAYVYGTRLEQTTRENVALHGIVVNGRMAVAEAPGRILDADEWAALMERADGALDPICGISFEPVTAAGRPTALAVAEEYVLACSPEHAEEWHEMVVAAEEEAVQAKSVALTAAAAGRGRTTLVIRVDFSDLAGDPFTETAGTNMIFRVNEFYRLMSYGKDGFAAVGDGSAITPTLRMPQTAAYYGARDASVLRRDARTAAADAGYVLRNYSYDLICFGEVPGFRFSGLAYVGGAGAWLRDTSSTGVAAHELGHNLGLNHANFWDTAGQSVIGSGTAVEYGDKFDTMGSANAGSKHFNARYKSLLNWLTSADVAAVTDSGTYRLFAHDDPAARGVRALRVAKGGGTNYWLEYRARYSGNAWLARGVGLRWAGTGSQATRLLDVSPGSPAGKDDSCLLLGRTFSDWAAGWHLTPVAFGTDPTPYVDVAVTKGVFANNRAPQAAWTQMPAAGGINTELTFALEASDPDGDGLAYGWDFGDDRGEANAPAVSHRWSAAGEYVVHVTVSDLRGAQTRLSAVVRIGNPTTYRVAGRITAEGLPLAGVRVSASSARVTYTDEDGRYTLVGLTAGSYPIKAVLEGFVFTRGGDVGDSEVRVGPSREGFDFVGIPPNGLNTVSLIVAGSVWRYLDDGSDGGTGWRAVTFDDGTWREGPAPLGYGDDNEKTVIRYGSNDQAKHGTTYFRRAFVVDDPARFNGLTVGLRRDDGAVVYLNGQEVLRSNMPTGTIGYRTRASSTTGGEDERTFFQADLDEELLRPGTNVVAVEVHQATQTSSDVVFDLELLALAIAETSSPTLSWAAAPGGLQLAWPEAGEWVLATTTDLSVANGWQRVPGVPEARDGRKVVVVPWTDRPQFFRLEAAASARTARTER